MLIEQARNEINTQVRLYFQASYEADEITLRQVFHPDAVIAGKFKGNDVAWTLEEFVTRIKTTEAYKHEPFLKEVLSMEGVNDVAIVKCQVLTGGNIFIDYLSLLKIEEKWLIRYKIFTC